MVIPHAKTDLFLTLSQNSWSMGFWKSNATSRPARGRLPSRKLTSPFWGLIKPAAASAKVVFPAPLLPTKARKS
jgi:hypothetical protein